MDRFQCLLLVTVDHEIKKSCVVVVQWRERNAPNSVMHVQSFADALKESSL